MANKINLAVFISGRGSNMQSLIDACRDPDFPARVEVVLSNKPDALGLTVAEESGIPTLIVSHKDYDTKADFEAAMIEALSHYEFDLICLAGFMRVLSADFIDHYQGRIINIHPSLLPDYKGLDTHARALADRKTEAGCTVHYVTPDIDSGEIIVQKSVPIKPDDTAETLAKRVLEQEHAAYPEAIKMIAGTYKSR